MALFTNVLATSMLFYVYVDPLANAYTTSEEGSCLDVMRTLLATGESGAVPIKPSLPNCNMCQGRAGKRGAVGPPGPRGPVGSRGEVGECICDLSEVERLREELQALRDDLQRKWRRVPETCYIGIANGLIPIADITASSSHSTCPFGDIRLNSVQAWCSSNNAAGTWVQIDLKSPRLLTGIVTQGRGNHDQWVKSYKVLIGNSVSSLQPYREGGVEKVFQANTGRNVKVENRFSNAITTRYIRIIPLTYRGHMSMRIELLDC